MQLGFAEFGPFAGSNPTADTELRCSDDRTHDVRCLSFLVLLAQQKRRGFPRLSDALKLCQRLVILPVRVLSLWEGI